MRRLAIVVLLWALLPGCELLIHADDLVQPDGSLAADASSAGPDAGSSCVPDLPCTPVDPCHIGATDCSTGEQLCADTGTYLPNGQGCGTKRVCADGACVPCDSGASCTSTNSCHSAALVCTSGSPVCTDDGNLEDGTACGQNNVCSGGQCVLCSDGMGCTPANPCHSGLISCNSGSPTCTDTGSSIVDGTPCGQDHVCSSGSCVSCVSGASCTPTNHCHLGTTSCSSGAQTCTDTGASVSDGSPCGANQVCSSGSCVSCSDGTSCTPVNPCHAGTIACGTGTPTCTDSGSSLVDGTPCGTNHVCSSGACVSCVSGASCRPASHCHLGTTSCSAGTQTCTDTGSNARNGTSCGVDQVCDSGACVPCVEGSLCTPTDPCHGGTWSCSTGKACVDNGRHIDTPGLVYPANLHAQLLGCTGSSLLSFALTAGAPNAYTAALSGDWNGDGISTLAFFVNNATVSGYVYSDTNGPGTTSTFQWFGGPNTSYRPVAGRWSAGSNPEMGLYNTTTGQFLLGRDPANNNARISFTQTHVPLDAKPVAGDWTGKGYDTVGLFSSGNFYLFDSHADAVPNEFAFGKADAQDHAIAGDWDGDGKDSIGLISAESGCASGWKVFLRNSNSNGFADRAYCVPTSTEAGAFSAVAGRWQ